MTVVRIKSAPTRRQVGAAVRGLEAVGFRQQIALRDGEPCILYVKP